MTEKRRVHPVPSKRCLRKRCLPVPSLCLRAWGEENLCPRNERQDLCLFMLAMPKPVLRQKKSRLPKRRVQKSKSPYLMFMRAYNYYIYYVPILLFLPSPRGAQCTCLVPKESLSVLSIKRGVPRDERVKKWEKEREREREWEIRERKMKIHRERDYSYYYLYILLLFIHIIIIIIICTNIIHSLLLLLLCLSYYIIIIIINIDY